MPAEKTFPEMERETLARWSAEKTFQKSLDKNPADRPFVFYEGPPFASGLPHYGHLLTSIAKDIVPRFQTMQGKKVERRWGWDCHGLPIETIAEKSLEISSKKDIEGKVGIEKFNAECRRHISGFEKDWEKIIDRFGRWLDWGDTYRTLDPDYTESVWWAFSELWKKNRVYEGRRVVPYCYRCETPLAVAETRADDATRPRRDLTMTVEFPVKYSIPSGKSIGLIAVNENNEILFLKRNKPGWENVWALPGGKVEPGQTFEEAAKMECREELGVECEILEMISAAPDFAEGKSAFAKIFRIKLLGEPRNAEPHKHAEIRWFSPENLPEIGFAPSREAIRNYLSGNRPIADCPEDAAPPPVSLLAWTTTPWTLPANQGLAVNPELEYAIVRGSTGALFVVADARVAELFHDGEFEILGKFPGKDLVGLEYEPLFPEIAGGSNNPRVNSGVNQDGGEAARSHRVFAADFVGAEEGTGVVHLAEYGEDDFRVFEKNGIEPLDLVDDRGRFVADAPVFAGLPIHGEETDRAILEEISSRDRLFSKQKMEHNYPHCWRCDTPLQYRPLRVWFVRVEDTREKMLKLNEQIRWVPENAGTGRFAAWLGGARDWLVSRNRYWGAPMPIWRDDETGETICVGSVAELEKLAKNPEAIRTADGAVELHRPAIDEIILISPETGRELRRIPEIFDCWIESGAMPFAQHHFPFENKEKFDGTHPGDFVVEYNGQCRTWFYYLHVLSTQLFDKPFAKNVVAHGILQGSDGRKLSKRLKNYSDPMETMEKYGADAVRWALAAIPLLRGGDGAIIDEYFADARNKILRPLWNSLQFLKLHGGKTGTENPAENPPARGENPEENPSARGQNPLDRWLRSESAILARTVGARLDAFDIPAALAPVPDFLDGFSNFWLRRSRERFSDENSSADRAAAEKTLRETLGFLAKVLAPVIPFLTEKIWAELGHPGSVHLENFPEPDPAAIDEKLSEKIARLRTAIELGRAVREREKIRTRQPLARAILAGVDFSAAEREIFADELRVENVEIAADPGEIAEVSVAPLGRKIGGKFGAEMGEIFAAARAGDFEILPDGSAKIGKKWTLAPDEFETRFDARPGLSAAADRGVLVALETEISEKLRLRGFENDLARAIQDARKAAGARPGEIVPAALETAAPVDRDALAARTRVEFLDKIPATETVEIDGFTAKIGVGKK